jgi:hypothetical protein
MEFELDGRLTSSSGLFGLTVVRGLEVVVVEYVVGLMVVVDDVVDLIVDMSGLRVVLEDAVVLVMSIKGLDDRLSKKSRRLIEYSYMMTEGDMPIDRISR